ncbi:hypothetical protein [Streptomyces sp. NBC_01363]|uniref:hypothetical protein n=1 Tax=Streptomyces sp. NBC_01363 TaxID=2903840 RepID=UPI002B1E4AFB|nr:hypothetical protein [Streptomyces sp. NBC_01363]
MTQPAPAPAQEPLPLDSTAQLLTRITAQLGTQLGLVALDGTRRTAPTLPASENLMNGHLPAAP